MLPSSIDLCWTDQGLKWIVEMESKNTVQEIRYDDSNYLKNMKKSISEGNVVVLVNIREKLDPELGNSKHAIIKTRSSLIRLCMFRFFIKIIYLINGYLRLTIKTSFRLVQN